MKAAVPYLFDRIRIPLLIGNRGNGEGMTRKEAGYAMVYQKRGMQLQLHPTVGTVAKVQHRARVLHCLPLEENFNQFD